MFSIREDSMREDEALEVAEGLHLQQDTANMSIVHYGANISIGSDYHLPFPSILYSI